MVDLPMMKIRWIYTEEASVFDEWNDLNIEVYAWNAWSSAYHSWISSADINKIDFLIKQVKFYFYGWLNQLDLS